MAGDNDDAIVNDDSNESDEELPSVPVAELKGHGEGPIHIIRITADGKYCITGGNDRTVRLWNPTRIDPAYNNNNNNSQRRLASSKMTLPPALPIQTYTEGHLHPVRALATSPSSSSSGTATTTVLLSASDKTLLCTDLLTAQTKQKWWGHMGRIESVCCFHTDQVYATGSYDATVRLWDARSRSKEPIQILSEAKDAITCVSPGNVSVPTEIISSSVDGKVRSYDVRTAKLLTEDVIHPITSISTTSDGMAMAASCLDGAIRLWERSSRGGASLMPASQSTAAAAAATTPNISRENTLLGTKVTHQFHSSHKAGNYGLECAFTSNDKYIVSGSECGAVVIYNVTPFSKTSNCSSFKNNSVHHVSKRLERHTAPTCSIACFPSDRPHLILSASYDGSAVVWSSVKEAEYCLDHS